MSSAIKASHPRTLLKSLPVALAICAALLQASGCASSGSSESRPNAQISAVGAENEYADVISQIGGRYVKVSAILRNPNVDPHTFEASPAVARSVGAARLIVENGAGYDDFMKKIESASPSSSRKVISAQALLGLPDSVPNPHLWYKPQTMPAVANAVAADLAAIKPAHAAYFQENVRRFEHALRPWLQSLAGFSKRYPDTTVATTEPVSDYMLEAAGIKNLTPFSMQADIMNGNDPAPQSVELQDALLADHQVKVFVYNQQVTDSLTEGFLKAAAQDRIPIVGVYETMPTPGFSYQSWMIAEVKALEDALRSRISTKQLEARG